MTRPGRKPKVSFDATTASSTLVLLTPSSSSSDGLEAGHSMSSFSDWLPKRPTASVTIGLRWWTPTLGGPGPRKQAGALVSDARRRGSFVAALIREVADRGREEFRS